MKSTFFLCLVLSLLTLSCSSNYKEEAIASRSMMRDEVVEAEMPASEMAYSTEVTNQPEPKVGDYISSSAAVEPEGLDKRFIRKANLKFKAADVIQTTYRIEDLIVSKGGYVESSTLRSEQHYTDTRHLTEDSLIQAIYYNLYSDLILRVPVSRLDSILKEIASFVDYLDFRTITATDATINLLRNRLETIRQYKYSQRVEDAVDDRNVKSNKVLDAELALLDAQEKADNAKLNTMVLNDQIIYSTIALTIYQEGLCKLTQTKAQPDLRMMEYTPGFWSKMGDAIRSGWKGLLEFILFLTEIWSVLFLFALTGTGIRYFWKRKKKVKKE